MKKTYVSILILLFLVTVACAAIVYFVPCDFNEKTGNCTATFLALNVGLPSAGAFVLFLPVTYFKLKKIDKPNQ